MTFIAHIRKKDEEEQLLKNHLYESAKISGVCGEKIGLEKICFLAGLMHDAGKFSTEFQRYLQAAYQDSDSVVVGSVDHSTYGARIVAQAAEPVGRIGKLLTELVGNAIMSHHSRKGLLDYVSAVDQNAAPYWERITVKDLPAYLEVRERFFSEVISESAFKKLIVQAVNELESLFRQFKPTKYDLFFTAKFIYSCLLEGDRSSTRLFEEKSKPEIFDYSAALVICQKHVAAKFLEFQTGKKTSINEWRMKLADQALEKAGEKTGIFSLPIPTGGGKTFTSLRFAIEHALIRKKERIIYVAPYTTILEQNAAEVREVIQQDSWVFEHHSNVFRDEEKSSEDNERQEALLRDTWEAPLIFTTMVQFLDNAFGGGTRNPRRFHQLVNAVIIFDEAQALPVKCTSLFNCLNNFLAKYCNTSIILCTATQPDFSELKIGMQEAEPLIADLQKVECAFRRVKVVNECKDQGWNQVEIVDKICAILKKESSLLVILNTKKIVQEVYRKVHDLADKDLYIVHLSTGMCPAHRKEKIDELRKLLKQDPTKRKKICCITTPLIEAGVDISFSSVLRSISGLDSIAQAAGRCNRHGEFAERKPIYLINPQADIENLSHLKEIKIRRDLTERLLKDLTLRGETDLLGSGAVNEYFHKLYQGHEQNGGSLNYPLKKEEQTTPFHLFEMIGPNKQSVNIYSLAHQNQPLPSVFSYSSATIAKYFSVIDTVATGVVVPYREGKHLIEQLNGSFDPQKRKGLFKALQPYTVNLFRYEFENLDKQRAIMELNVGNIYALEDFAYNEEFGLDIAAESPMPDLINGG